jgi:DNA-binding MarR family transcriptional regulator
VHIALAPHGEAAFEGLIALALGRNRELVARLSQAEIAALLATLDRLLANARKMVARGQAQARRSS